MSSDGPADSITDSVLTAVSSTRVRAGNWNAGGTAPPPTNSNLRLQLHPTQDHQPENYGDLGSEFTPQLYSSVERYLPPQLLNAPRETKFRYIRDILRRYYPTEEERRHERWLNKYKAKIASTYQPLHRELYQVNAATFFVPSFINAFTANDYNRTENIRNIISEPAPGIYTFDMFQPHFCEMMLAEVENIEKCILETGLSTMCPTTMHKFGHDLDHFGMESMFGKLMQDFICHISNIFFGEFGGFRLDSHYGYVVEYGSGRDVELGLHVDDSEVTLNVCLGKQFSGGDLFFRGVRCEKHQQSGSLPEEIFEYPHVPGHAIIHAGRNRHGARATTSGHRVNLLIWCRSSVFRAMRKHSRAFASWCAECRREQKEKIDQLAAAKKATMVIKLEDMNFD